MHQIVRIGLTIICGRNKKTFLLRTRDESNDIWCRKATQVAVSWHIHISPYFYHGTSGAHARWLSCRDGQQNKWRPGKEWPGALMCRDCLTHVSCLSSWHQVSSLLSKLFQLHSCATKQSEIKYTPNLVTCCLLDLDCEKKEKHMHKKPVGDAV